MGNNNSDMSETEFRQKWKPVQSAGSVSVWQSNENPDQKVEQYQVRENEAEFSEKLYQLRRNNPFLVNAYTLRKEGFSCQVDHDTKKLFVERIPLRLSNVENIPYPDVLHLYDSSLNGYSQLASAVGPFSIDEDQIGINERGKVKVWLNNLYQSGRVGGAKVSEPVMVKELLKILQANTDNESRGRYPDLAWYIGSHDNITFRQAQQKFIQYVKEYTNGELPLYLNCVFEHGGSGIIENWCRNHDSYGYAGSSIREREQLYRNKANAPVGVVSPQINSVSVVNNQPQQGSIVSATQYGSGAQASQPVTIQTQPVQYGSRAQVSQPVTIQTQPVQYGSRVQASQPVSIQTQPAQPQPQQVSFQGPQPVSNIQMMGYSQQPPQTITNNNKVSVPTPRFANEKRIELGGPQIINFPRPEERVISEKIIEGAPYLQQPPPNHSVRVTTGAPGVQYPVVTREVQRVNGPLPPIPEQPFSVNSSLNIQRQEGAPILQFNNQQYTQNTRAVVQGQQPEQILSYPPQIVDSITYTRSSDKANTTKILQNLQGNVITENKGDYVVTSVPSGFSDNRLQQQRVISQTIELKDGNTIPSAQQAFVAQPTTTYQTDFKPNYGTQDFTSKNNTQDYTKITKTETADTGIANFGRTVPYSFNVEEDKKFESKVDSSKFAPNEDGKSSPDFLAFLNQIKSGSGSSGFNASSTVSQNQKLGTLGTSGSKQGLGTYEATAAQGATYQAGSYDYKPEQFKFSSGDYNLGKYEANIDPDLSADLLKFKQ